MSKTKIISVALLLIGLTGMSLYLNRDWFASDTIQISHRASPWMKNRRPGRRPSGDLGIPVTFTLGGYYKLTKLHIVEAAKFETNKYTVPLWRLVSDSNSAAISSFNYGSYIKGMRPEAKGVRPEPLEAGVAYRLIVDTAKDLHAEHDFIIATNK